MVLWNESQNHQSGWSNAGRTSQYDCSYTTPYSQHHQSGWSSTGGGYYGNGPVLPSPAPQVSGQYGSYYHSHNSYGNGMNNGYQQSKWTLKNLDNE
ncbi:hypothetical protein Hanom_Chr06g00505281 [Helianthus anomalus]